MILHCKKEIFFVLKYLFYFQSLRMLFPLTIFILSLVNISFGNYWKKTVSKIKLNFLLQFYKKAQNSFEPCGDNGWVPYLDTKCFKIFPNELKYRDEAENYCKEERFQSYIPSLVIIKSRSEQEFVANLVFNISGSFDSVWIDAKRNSDNKTFFMEWWIQNWMQ